jgi:hypothetical protein
MKQLIQLNLTLIALFLSACTTQTAAPTSHNSDKTSGFLQKHLDNWLETEWDPSVKEKDKETQERFRLQDYVDKASLYMQAHPSDENSSHIKKLESMPVIGK